MLDNHPTSTLKTPITTLTIKNPNPNPKFNSSDVRQVVPAKASLLAAMLEEVVGKEEVMLRRLINESEEVAKHRDDLRKRLVLLQKAQREITAFV